MSRKKIITFILLTCLIAGGWWFWTHKGDDDKNLKASKAPVPVRVIDAMPTDIPIFLSGIGNVVSFNSVIVRPQVDGELKALHFEEGETVVKGEVLAEIDDRALKAAHDSARAEKASSEARLAIAQTDLKRYNTLLQDDAIANQLVDQQKATVQQLKAAVDVAQAAVDTTAVQLSFTKVIAPITGQAGIRRVDVGNIISASNTEGIVTITQIDPITVLFAMPQTALDDLLPLLKQQNRPVEIMDREGSATIATGQLAAIDNQINQTTGTVRLKAVIPNRKKTLWPGQFVVARLKVKTLRDKISLPVPSVQRGQNKVFVYRVKGNTAEAVEVIVTHEDEKQVVVDGLEPGDKIIYDGQLRVKPGAMVSISGANSPSVSAED